MDVHILRLDSRFRGNDDNRDYGTGLMIKGNFTPTFYSNIF